MMDPSGSIPLPRGESADQQQQGFEWFPESLFLYLNNGRPTNLLVDIGSPLDDTLTFWFI
jgi:hypothetical protein